MKAIRQIYGLVEADFRKIIHDPMQLIPRLLQPIIWLVFFGTALEKVASISVGGSTYLQYFAPGILGQSILLVSIFYGIELIWEKDSGLLQKLLVTPTPRTFLVIGRGLAAGIRTLPQVIIVYIFSFILGIGLKFSIVSFLGIIAMALLGATTFLCFSLGIASLVKKRERFMGAGQVMIMPLFFASNALYPLNDMPHWIKVFSHFNPLTYQVDALRAFMTPGQTSHFGLLTDFGVVGLYFIFFLVISTWLFPKITY